MRLYLDDDSASPRLATQLRQAGHDVQIPADVGKTGENDPVHLIHAVRDDRTLLSKNYDDFEDLHDLVVAVKGHHPGILVIRQDNDPKRDLKNHDIVRAIGKLLAAGVPVADEYIVLNHWR
jgi:predicted nuclease of predicted toxin-antitoxin system